MLSHFYLGFVCFVTRPRCQVSVYMTIGHLVILNLLFKCFGVRVSVTFHLTRVHIIFISVGFLPSGHLLGNNYSLG